MRLYIFRGRGSNGSNELRGVIVVSAKSMDEAIQLVKDKIKDTEVECEVLETAPESFAQKTVWYIQEEIRNPPNFHSTEGKIVFSHWFSVS